jgi:hypothetical protein
MEMTDEVLISWFAAWRAEIDSMPFAHEAECDRVVRALLDSRRHPEREICPHLLRSQQQCHSVGAVGS